MDEWKKGFFVGLISWPLAFLLFLLILTCHKSNAEELELITGGITEHLISYPGANTVFRTDIGDSGNLIYNPMVGIRYETSKDGLYEAITSFGGDNSIGRPMLGTIYESGAKGEYTEVGMLIGGYIQERLADANVHTMDLPSVGDYEFMPLVGLDVTFKYHFTKDFFIAEHNITALGLLNFSVGIGRSF